MSAKFSPGPWRLYVDAPTTEPNWHIVTSAGRTRVIANVHIEPGNAIDICNARLIAAAPELLEALKDAVSMLDDLKFRSDADQEGAVTEQIREANSIIAKATGDQP